MNEANGRSKWLILYVVSKTSQKFKYEEIALPSAKKPLLSVPGLSTSLTKKNSGSDSAFSWKYLRTEINSLLMLFLRCRIQSNNLLRAYFFITFSVVNCINTRNVRRTNHYINQVGHNASANLWSMCLVRVKVMDLIQAW